MPLGVPPRRLFSFSERAKNKSVKHEYGGSNMLVLSRKSQESVVIGGNDAFARLLKITVLDIAFGKVRLGFEVDADIPVHRQEIWERIRSEREPEHPKEALRIAVTE
jgi:carbon storage regulator